MAFLLDAMQRRRLGLTQRNVRRILVAMETDGQFAERTSEQLLADKASIALSVVEVLRAENKQAFCDADAREIDWDKFFELLEKLITLLLPFIIKSRS